MNKIFQYTKTEGQGWLVEKPEMEKPNDNDFYEPDYEEPGRLWFDSDSRNMELKKYNQHIASLRRFKYDYPDPGKEMELEKDFEVKYEIGIVFNQTHIWQRVNKTSFDYDPHEENKRIIAVPVPITQRTYSEQEDAHQKAINWAAKIIDSQKLEIQRLKGLIELMFADSEIIKGSWQTFKNENNL